MLGTREYTLFSPFRANAHNSSLFCICQGYVLDLISIIPGDIRAIYSLFVQGDIKGRLFSICSG